MLEEERMSKQEVCEIIRIIEEWYGEICFRIPNRLYYICRYLSVMLIRGYNPNTFSYLLLHLI